MEIALAVSLPLTPLQIERRLIPVRHNQSVTNTDLVLQLKQETARIHFSKIAETTNLAVLTCNHPSKHDQGFLVFRAVTVPSLFDEEMCRIILRFNMFICYTQLATAHHCNESSQCQFRGSLDQFWVKLAAQHIQVQYSILSCQDKVLG